MFKNVLCKFQLQILRFDEKPSIYLCSGTDASRAVLKNSIRNGTIGRETGIVELMEYMNLKGIQGRGNFFLPGICFQMFLQSIISETCLPFCFLSIIVLPVAEAHHFGFIFGYFFFLTTLSNHSLHLGYSGYLAI